MADSASREEIQQVVAAMQGALGRLGESGVGIAAESTMMLAIARANLHNPEVITKILPRLKYPVSALPALVELSTTDLLSGDESFAEMVRNAFKDAINALFDQEKFDEAHRTQVLAPIPRAIFEAMQPPKSVEDAEAERRQGIADGLLAQFKEWEEWREGTLNDLWREIKTELDADPMILSRPAVRQLLVRFVPHVLQEMDLRPESEVLYVWACTANNYRPHEFAAPAGEGKPVGAVESFMNIYSPPWKRLGGWFVWCDRALDESSGVDASDYPFKGLESCLHDAMVTQFGFVKASVSDGEPQVRAGAEALAQG